MRRPSTSLRRLLYATALLTCVTLGGCATQASENFYAVREGMSKTEVEQLLGRPSSQWSGEAGTERWQWGDSLSSLATTGLFQEPDTARVWVVWFDSEGRVVDSSEPAWRRDQ